jgi:predicted DNA-binding protein
VDTPRRRELDQALTVRLPSELHDRLRAVAEREDRTIAGLLRLAAARFLDDHESLKTA